METDVKMALTVTAIWVLPAVAWLAAPMYSEIKKICEATLITVGLTAVLFWIAAFIGFVWRL